jgi:hypothetical protein
VNKYAYSVKEQSIAAKKVYGIDNGLINTLGFSFSPNTGRLLENLVYLQLKRQNVPIYYFKTKTGKEVDFYLPKTGELIQVSLNIQNPETLEREISALSDASDEILAQGGKTKRLLITIDNSSQIEKYSKGVNIISLSDYLLST